MVIVCSNTCKYKEWLNLITPRKTLTVVKRRWIRNCFYIWWSLNTCTIYLKRHTIVQHCIILSIVCCTISMCIIIPTYCFYSHEQVPWVLSISNWSYIILCWIVPNIVCFWVITKVFWEINCCIVEVFITDTQGLEFDYMWICWIGNIKWVVIEIDWCIWLT